MIFLGSDHGGFKLKELIKEWLREWNLEFKDLGAHTLEPEDDYPKYAFAVTEAVAGSDDPKKNWKDRPKGILICRSSLGMTVAANKIPGARAGAVFDEDMAKHARYNDDINIITLAGDWLKPIQAKQVLKIWLDTEFSRKARYSRRLQQISDKENMLYGCCQGGCCGD
jgi:ribose 5-phosphate isomerase B